jgi:hypothetical protein
MHLTSWKELMDSDIEGVKNKKGLLNKAFIF